MATQRMTIVTLVGEAAVAVANHFSKSPSSGRPEDVDQICLAILENALSPSIVYFAAWIDRWLMGDTLPGPESMSR